MTEPYVLSAFASMVSAIFIAAGAYILLEAVKRIGRIGDDLLRSLQVIENLGPNPIFQPNSDQTTLASAARGDPMREDAS